MWNTTVARGGGSTQSEEEGAFSQRRKEHSEEEGALRGRKSTQRRKEHSEEEGGLRGGRSIQRRKEHSVRGGGSQGKEVQKAEPQEGMPPRTEQKGSVKENPRNFLRDTARLQRTRSFSMKHSVVLLG